MSVYFGTAENNVFANSTAVYTNGIVKITSPINAEKINFYAPSDGNPNDLYELNGKQVILSGVLNNTPASNWVKGAPISGVYDADTNKLFVNSINGSKSVFSNLFRNSTAQLKSGGGGTLLINSVEEAVDLFNFYAPSNFDSTNTYEINGKKYNLVDTKGEKVESGWIKGAPVSLVLNEGKVWYSVSASDGATNSDLSPLCPNFRVERKGDKVKISADKIQLNEYTDMTAGGVWAWGKARPTKPEGENIKRWSKAEITTTGKPFDGMYLGDITASDSVNETLLWLPENKNSKAVLVPFIVLSIDYLGGVYVMRKHTSKDFYGLVRNQNGSYFGGGADVWITNTYLNSVLGKNVSSALLDCEITTAGVKQKRKCWIPGMPEVGSNNYPGDGEKMPYFVSDQRRIAYDEDTGTPHASGYWTRTQASSTHNFSIGSTGKATQTIVTNFTCYRPSFVLPKDFKIQQRPDGSYTVWNEMGLMTLGDIEPSTESSLTKISVGEPSGLVVFDYLTSNYNDTKRGLLFRESSLGNSILGNDYNASSGSQYLKIVIDTWESSLSSGLKQLIEPIKIKYLGDNNTAGPVVREVTVRAFALSTGEIFGYPNTGPQISALTNINYRKRSGAYWTRDISAVSSRENTGWLVWSDGSSSTNKVTTTGGAVPAFTLPLTSPVRALPDGTYDLVPEDPALSQKQTRAPEVLVEPPKGTPIQLKDIPVATTSSPVYTTLTDNGKQQKYVIVQNNIGASTPNVILYREGILPDTIQFNRIASESYHPYENSELDAYCSNYISKLDENVRKHLVEAPIVLYDSQSKQTKTINRKAFTPSIANIFGNTASVGNTQFEWAKTWSNLKLPLGNTFWSSTTSVGMGTRKIEAIGASGAFYSRGQTETAAVMFLIAMNPDTWFLDNGDGTYTFVGDEPAPAEQPLEIEIDWPESDPLIARQWVYNQKGVYQTMLLGGVASTEDAPPPPSYSKVLADNSWEQIAQAAADGVAQDLWKIGDIKDIVVNGETLTVAIMDFNHDDLADGSGKAPITFGMTQLMKDFRRIKPNNSNRGGFKNTELYTYFTNTLLPTFPKDLQNTIAEVNKKTATGGGSGIMLTESLKLFLFAGVEVKDAYGSYQGEGTQYPYYSTASNRIKKKSNGAGEVFNWFTRSPSKNYNGNNVYIDDSGDTKEQGTPGNVNVNSGISFGFCI